MLTSLSLVKKTLRLPYYKVVKKIFRTRDEFFKVVYKIKKIFISVPSINLKIFFVIFIFWVYVKKSKEKVMNLFIYYFFMNMNL